MFKINLLPWRETLHATHNRKLKLQILFTFVCGISVILIWQMLLLYTQHSLLTQQKYLTAQRSALISQINEIIQLKKTQLTLTQTLKLKQRINAEQVTLRQLLLALNNLPLTITLTELQKNDSFIVLQGQIRSKSALNALLAITSKISHLTTSLTLSNLDNHFFTLTCKYAL